LQNSCGIVEQLWYCGIIAVLQIIAYCENCEINPLKSTIFAIINPQLILQPIGYRSILNYIQGFWNSNMLD